MKFVAATVLGLLCSASVFASTANDSWATIIADKSVTISQPAQAAAFGAGGFFNACVDGAQIRSLTAVPTCEAWVVLRSNGGGTDAGPNDLTCSKVVSKYASIPLVQTTTTCAKYDYVGGGQDAGQPSCLKLQTVSYTLPTTMNFMVFSRQTGGANNNDGGEQLFVKSYTIPACKKVVPPTPAAL